MERVNKNIVFFYPSKIVGGAEYLFMRSALFLANEMSLSVKYIDYKDGFVAKQLSGTKVEVILFKDYKKSNVPVESIVITPFSFAFKVLYDLRGDFKIFFWAIHPTAIYDAILINLKYSNKSFDVFKDDIKLINNHSAVCFMDGSNLDFLEDKFGKMIKEEVFLPIFTLEKKEPKVAKKLLTNTIHLGWLGRLSIEKVNPLINILNHIREYAKINKNCSIVFHIIGDGDMKELVIKESVPSNVEVRFLGTLINDNLYNYIYENIDVMFGMGTSTLEVASLRKAIVLVDFSFDAINSTDNSFRWLFESTRYSVGDEYNKDVNYKHSLSDIIELIEKDKLRKIEDLCYNYFKGNHDVSSVCNLLVEMSNSSTLTNNMLKQSGFGKFTKLDLIKKINHFRKACFNEN